MFIGASPSYTSFSWNNASVSVNKSVAGFYTVTLPGPSTFPRAPAITDWKWKDSLPEIAANYDDLAWTSASDITTNNTNKPYTDYKGPYVLYGQNYEYAIGSLILRGHFKAKGKETGLDISLSAGSFGAGMFFVSRALSKVELSCERLGNCSALRDRS